MLNGVFPDFTQKVWDNLLQDLFDSLVENTGKIVELLNNKGEFDNKRTLIVPLADHRGFLMHWKKIDGWIAAEILSINNKTRFMLVFFRSGQPPKEVVWDEIFKLENPNYSINIEYVDKGFGEDEELPGWESVNREPTIDVNIHLLGILSNYVEHLSKQPNKGVGDGNQSVAS